MAGIAGAAPVTEATLGAPPNAAPPGAGPPANAPIVSSVGRGPLAAAAAGSGPAAFPATASTGAAASAEEEEAAATRIQATFKGKKARAEFAASRESSPRKAADSPAAASSAAAAAPVARVANPRADFLVSAAATFGAADPSSASVSRWAAFAGTAIASLVPAAPSGLRPRARSPARVQDHDRRGRVVRVRSRGVPRVESRRRLGGSRRVEFLRRNRREFSRAHVLERAARDPTPSRRG